MLRSILPLCVLVALAPPKPIHAQNPPDDPARCLALAAYFEAKGQSAAAMEAVAAVVLNRAAHVAYPNDPCAVVYQGADGASCQFGWACDGEPDRPKEPEEWAKAERAAAAALASGFEDPTGGAIYFHVQGVNPGYGIETLTTVTIEPFAFRKNTPEHDAALEEEASLRER